jgi:hypothetical protein
MTHAWRIASSLWTAGLQAASLVLLVSRTPEAVPQQAPPVAEVPDVRTLGPQVGQRVPDFILVDQRGRRQSLDAVMGPKGLMLVFFRSADW